MALFSEQRYTHAPNERVEVDLSHHLANGMVGFFAPTVGNGLTIEVSNKGLPRYDLIGNPMSYKDSNSNVVMGRRASSNPTMDTEWYNTYISKHSQNPSFSNPLTSSDDVTCMASGAVNALSADRGIFGFGTNQWSWFDQSGGVLRVSAFTQYDTANPITTIGTISGGLIWKSNNAYQMIQYGRFGASGSSTRQGITGDVAVFNTVVSGAITSKHWNSESAFSTTVQAWPQWWAMWKRPLSEAETFSFYQNPWQVLKPIKAKMYFFPAAAGGGGRIMSSLAANGGLAGMGGIAGQGGGLAG